MISAIEQIQSKPQSEKEKALERLHALKSELVQRLSQGRYLSGEQKEWEQMPEYLREIVLLLSGIEGRATCAAWLSFNAIERGNIMQIVSLLKGDLSPIVSMTLGSARAAQS